MSARTFKQLVRDDILKTFLNGEEFADVHTIDGKPMKVMVDKNELIDRQPSATYTDGLYIGDLLIYVAAEDYGPRPKIGKTLLLDGKKQYRIIDCTDEYGMYSLTLEAVSV